MIVGFGAVTLYMLIGTTLGICAGFFRGPMDDQASCA